MSHALPPSNSMNTGKTASIAHISAWLANWTPRHRHHDPTLHLLNQWHSLVHSLAPARHTPALLPASSALFKVGKLPQVVDRVEISDLNEPSSDAYEFVLALGSRHSSLAVYSPSITSLRAARPFCQCVSHSSKLPGCSVYERSSKTPPSCLGGLVGQKRNSCISEVFLLLMSVLSFRSNSANSG